MKIKSVFVLAALLSSAALSYADEKAPDTSKDLNIIQFPDEAWDGKNIEYTIQVNFPKMDGKTIEEAEGIRKFYVTESFKKGIQFLTRLVTFDARDLRFNYSADDCRKEELLPPVQAGNIQLAIKRKSLIEDCKLISGDEDGKHGEYSVNSYNNLVKSYPERDIGALAHEDLIDFSAFAEKNHLSFAGNGESQNNYIDMDMSSDDRSGSIGVLHPLKDSLGKQDPVFNLEFRSGFAVVDRHSDGKDIFIGHHQWLYGNSNTLANGSKIRYLVPNVGMGAVLGLNGYAGHLAIVVPNRNLVTLFQGSGPSVTFPLMNKAGAAIKSNLTPYGLRLESSFEDGGLSGLVEEPSDEAITNGATPGGVKKLTPKKPKWLRNVDIQTGKELWAYLLLGSLKVEAKRDKSNPNQVEIKMNVPMDELRKLADSYANYMEK